MHFTQSQDPLHFRTVGPIETLCKKWLSDVELCFEFNGEIVGRNLKQMLVEQYELNSLSICRKCVTAEFTERYLSGIRPRTDEREAEVA